MTHFTPWTALLGGVLIGLAASLLLLANGRIAGISNAVAGVLRPQPGDTRWRVAFLAGLLLAGFGAVWLAPERVAPSPHSLGILVLAGVLVGFGTKLANGCTSGHGVCGISRGSPRSLIATATFMATGVLTVALLRALTGAP